MKPLGKLPVISLIAVNISFLLFLLTVGCGGERSRYGDTNELTPPSEFFSDTDFKLLMSSIASELRGMLAARGKDETLLFFPVSNRTSDRIDMDGFTDSLVTAVVRSSRFRVINYRLRDPLTEEIRYWEEAANRKKTAKQVGADIIISGRLSSIVVRPGSNRMIRYYLLVIKATDVAAGTIIGTLERELKKQLKRTRIAF